MVIKTELIKMKISATLQVCGSCIRLGHGRQNQARAPGREEKGHLCVISQEGRYSQCIYPHKKVPFNMTGICLGRCLGGEEEWERAAGK